MSKKNLIVGQSGGPTAVINSSLYGVVSEGLRHPEQIQHIYGMVNGIEGFLAGTVLDFATALPGAGFGVDTNVITIITRSETTELPLQSKESAANAILDAALRLTP